MLNQGLLTDGRGYYYSTPLSVPSPFVANHSRRNLYNAGMRSVIISEEAWLASCTRRSAWGRTRCHSPCLFSWVPILGLDSLGAPLWFLRPEPLLILLPSLMCIAFRYQDFEPRQVPTGAQVHPEAGGQSLPRQQMMCVTVLPRCCSRGLLACRALSTGLMLCFSPKAECRPDSGCIPGCVL